MTRKITPTQRRALLWLLEHGGAQKMSDLMISGGVSAQTIHSLVYDRLVSARYAAVWASGKRPIDTVQVTTAGRAAVE